jgi:hypothetical protein
MDFELRESESVIIVAQKLAYISIFRISTESSPIFTFFAGSQGEAGAVRYNVTLFCQNNLDFRP